MVAREYRYLGGLSSQSGQRGGVAEMAQIVGGGRPVNDAERRVIAHLRDNAPDDWLLLRQHSPAMAQGRCFGRGDVFTESGELVASFAQEAMVRFPEH